MDRRDFLRAGAAGAAAAAAMGAISPEIALAKRPVSEPTTSALTAVDVTEHGAQGDGASDDTAAIQTAIDAAAWTDETHTEWRGASVYFPPGEYVISDTLTLPSYTSLVGEPGGMSRIKLADGADCDMVATVLDGTYNERQAIEHLYLDGNRANQTMECHGLRFFESMRPLLYHCVITQVNGYALHMAGQSSYTMQPMVSHCVIVENSRGVGLFAGCTDSLFYNCDIGQNVYGMAIQGGAHVIQGCAIWGNWVGAQVTTAHVTFNGVRVDQNQAYGLEFTTSQCRSCQVSGCSIYWNGQAAAGTYSGVHIHNGASDVLIASSMIGSGYADGGSETQAYGVLADETTSGIELGANMYRANMLGDTQLLGAV
jgi:hypothetical protein